MATATRSTPITELQALGQSVWMDYMSRKFVQNGDLRRLIEEDDLRGVTSNPTIFEKAIGHSADYDQDFRRMVEGGADADELYAALRAAMTHTRADRQAYDQIVQNLFAQAASKMSHEGRLALANWPPNRKSPSQAR